MARRASDQLSEELESPENKQRWRRLEGKIPDKAGCLLIGPSNGR
jgi:hypothetical protein